MKDADTLARERLTGALSLCRGYAGSDESKALIALFDSLVETYRLDLERVSAEQLPRLQGALRQVRALQASLIAEVGELPRI